MSFITATHEREFSRAPAHRAPGVFQKKKKASTDRVLDQLLPRPEDIREQGSTSVDRVLDQVLRSGDSEDSAIRELQRTPVRAASAILHGFQNSSFRKCSCILKAA